MEEEDDDKTVLKPQRSSKIEPDSDRTIIVQPDALSVELLDAQGEIMGTFSFSHHFNAGRALDNAIVIDSGAVSRHHLEVKQENSDWWVYNLKSVNGVYIDNRLIEHKEKLNFPVNISLGFSGIYLKIQQTKNGMPLESEPAKAVLADHPKPNVVASDKPQRQLSAAEIKARLLAEEEAQDAGDYTRMVRKLIHEDRTVRGKSYKKVIWVLAVLFCLSVGLGAYQQIALANTKKLAIDMFYDIKTLEVSLSQADLKLEESSVALDKAIHSIANEKMRVVMDQLKAEQAKIAAERQRMLAEREKLASMKAKYQKYVEQANSLRIRFPTSSRYEEELIAKVARDLGESELELPDGFVAEVKKYIQYWQNTPRMESAINYAQKNNYFPIIIGALKQEGLPLQFLYLPLQESNYNEKIIGPATRYGIAKGAWQFIPETGRRYGLTTGPLVDVRQYDEQDERFHFNKASKAGAKYLKDIYSTKAQASGLLVIASYNWGEGRIIKRLQQMPNNPRERNFWKFIQQYKMPDETYGYVFYIFAAAVIGEDPKHFGFKFNPPLLSAETDKSG